MNLDQIGSFFGAARNLVGRGAAELRASSLQAGKGSRYSVALVMSGGESTAYQANQWMWPLEQLNAALLSQGLPGVVIVVRDARLALALRETSPLPLVWVKKLAELLEFLEQDGLNVVLYPNQAVKNFQALSVATAAHLHLSHGESEKISMVSNQLKAYDLVLSAGQAARERVLEHLIGFDESKFRDVGRPQLDEPRPLPSNVKSTTLTTTLYAPTWEGDTPAMSYSSVGVAGEKIVNELLGMGRRVIYRPHPQTGVRSRQVKEADARIRKTLEQAPGGHVVDTGAALNWQWDAADEILVDMSAMAFDALAVSKPLVVLEPKAASASRRSGGLLSKVTTTPAGEPQLLDAFERAAAPEALQRDAQLAQYYFGDTRPGAQVQRFVDAVMHAGEERSKLLKQRASAYEQ